jgi:hypothetical protein
MHIPALPDSIGQLSNLTALTLQENPELQLPAGAPLSESGKPYYDSADAVGAFLSCL